MRDLAPNMTDYLEARASFRLEVPDEYNYARDVVDAWAAREPDKLALLAVGPDGGDARRFSFADLARTSDRAASTTAVGAAGYPEPLHPAPRARSARAAVRAGRRRSRRCGLGRGA